LTIQSSSSSKISRKNNEIIVGKSSGLAEKSKNRLRKHQEKHESEREKARDDAVVDISMDDILNIQPEDGEQASLPPVAKAEGKAGAAVQVNDDSDGSSEVNSEAEEQERKLAAKKRKGKGKAKDQGTTKPFAQRDLVSLAFAGDKVVQVC
jgi:U3 small nucleolar RNA-associated protein 14